VQRVATRALSRVPAVVAGALGGLLLLLAGRYGYHRDELYFLAAGDHLAWAYPDQGPLVPALARLLDTLAPGSLVALRAVAASCAAGIVLLSALIARELGGGAGAQTIAAACTAVAAFVMGTGHLFSTTTLDLLGWTLVIWLTIRASRRRASRLWLAVGVVAGLALLVKPLIAFLLLAMLAGVAISGPRRLLRDPWVWAGALVAAAIAAPYVGWQASHGWPQLEMSRAIAAGSSGSSQPRWLLLPMQLVLVSPFLVPVWVAGLVRLLRDPDVRDVRFLGWAYVVLAVAFLVTGGKPYYLAQLSPALLGAGAVPVARWARTGARTAVLAAAVALSAVIGGVITLPVLPADRVNPVLAVNYDAGETIGWPAFVHDVSRAVAGLTPAERGSAVILTGNYGEAGALQRFGRDLPPVFSGHNGYGEWGPPRGSAGPVILVGYVSPDVLDRVLAGCRRVGTVDNRLGIDNDEQGAPIRRCDGPSTTWAQAWPAVRHLG
jgi:dolichyl-phosphate-mannose-protein mannosyltransferase